MIKTKNKRMVSPLRVKEIERGLIIPRVILGIKDMTKSAPRSVVQWWAAMANELDVNDAIRQSRIVQEHQAILQNAETKFIIEKSKAQEQMRDRLDEMTAVFLAQMEKRDTCFAAKMNAQRTK